MRPRIRPFNREDKPAIIQILQNVPEFKPPEVDIAEEVLDSYIQEPIRSGYQILVAEVGSLIVGYICYGSTPLTEGTWDIYWMAVDPGRQGQGIGKNLLASAENTIRKTNGRLALIETSSKPEYEATRRFHLSQGYEWALPDSGFLRAGGR